MAKGRHGAGQEKKTKTVATRAIERIFLNLTASMEPYAHCDLVILHHVM